MVLCDGNERIVTLRDVLIHVGIKLNFHSDHCALSLSLSLACYVFVGSENVNIVVGGKRADIPIRVALDELIEKGATCKFFGIEKESCIEFSIPSLPIFTYWIS
jgi:hypothetical protein